MVACHSDVVSSHLYSIRPYIEFNVVQPGTHPEFALLGLRLKMEGFRVACESSHVSAQSVF